MADIKLAKEGRGSVDLQIVSHSADGRPESTLQLKVFNSANEVSLILKSYFKVQMVLNNFQYI